MKKLEFKLSIREGFINSYEAQGKKNNYTITKLFDAYIITINKQFPEQSIIKTFSEAENFCNEIELKG